jgi:hypothetical protein
MRLVRSTRIFFCGFDTLQVDGISGATPGRSVEILGMREKARANRLCHSGLQAVPWTIL